MCQKIKSAELLASAERATNVLLIMSLNRPEGTLSIGPTALFSVLFFWFCRPAASIAAEDTCQIRHCTAATETQVIPRQAWD